MPSNTFMDSKRRAGCCSKFTYWYANNLVDSVNMNKGKLHPKMLETMNTDPQRDVKLLKEFQAKLKAC